ncbi:MAG: hypothetical protein J2P43_04010 [Candidatus Dormibacteraeota bacterium]|nr:hypothetical protein [Candidatus Dormibacteraeota bacterium]MBO0744162.1 hypothetical protein [Candidatus Dormibacteraeota bacterium]
MDARRRLRLVVVLAVLSLVATGCGTAGRCSAQPLQVVGGAVTSTQVERSVGVVTACVGPGVGCRRATALPIGGGYWLTAASMARNVGTSLFPGAPSWSVVAVTSGGRRYRASLARAAPVRGYALFEAPETANVLGLPLDTGAPHQLDRATVVCVEPTRTVTYSGSLFLTTPSESDVDLFEVNSPDAIADCAGGPVLDRGVVVGVQVFTVTGGAWAAPTSAMTGLPSTSTASCRS